MSYSEIPLQPQNQTFSATIAGNIYNFRLIWRAGCWYMDLSDSSDSLLVGSIPLVTGADLLEQYSYLGLGFSLVVICDVAGQDYPTEFDLGISSHLIIITE